MPTIHSTDQFHVFLVEHRTLLDVHFHKRFYFVQICLAFSTSPDKPYFFHDLINGYAVFVFKMMLILDLNLSSIALDPNNPCQNACLLRR